MVIIVVIEMVVVLLHLLLVLLLLLLVALVLAEKRGAGLKGSAARCGQMLRNAGWTKGPRDRKRGNVYYPPRSRA